MIRIEIVQSINPRTIPIRLINFGLVTVGICDLNLVGLSHGQDVTLKSDHVARRTVRRNGQVSVDITLLAVIPDTIASIVVPMNREVIECVDHIRCDTAPRRREIVCADRAIEIEVPAAVLTKRCLIAIDGETHPVVVEIIRGNRRTVIVRRALLEITPETNKAARLNEFLVALEAPSSNVRVVASGLLGNPQIRYLSGQVYVLLSILIARVSWLTAVATALPSS